MGRKKPQISPNPTLFVINGKRDPEALQRQRSVNSQELKTEEVIIYGEDNALPLRIASAVSESPAASACINTRAKYIKGSGFSNPELMKLVIDRNGTTLWQLHSMLSDMLALYYGFAVNFKYDYVARITNAYAMSFENCRLGIPDSSGYISKIKYNPYYGTKEYKKQFTDEYDVFDIKQVVNQQQTVGTDYRGQVYYYGKTTPIHRFYPVPDYWSAKRWIEIDGKIQEFHSENLENGFFQSVLINMIGDPSRPSTDPKNQEEYTDSSGVKRTRATKTQGQEFNEMMGENFSGSRKAGTALVLWSGNANDAPKVQPFETNSNADLFNALQDLTTKNITIGTQVPGILANISEGVNLGSTGNEMQKAVELMHSRVKEEQTLLMQFYNEILLPNFHQTVDQRVEILNFNPVTVPVTIEDKFWEVLTDQEKRAFVKRNLQSVELIDDVQNTTSGAVEISDPKTNEAIKSLKMSEIDRIQKIVRRFNIYQNDPENPKGLTYEQAKQFLLGYGIGEQEVGNWLVTDAEL